jgi:phage-related tail fiber protein
MSYYTLLTDIGLAKLANAQVLGTIVQWSEMAVGDGNGNPTTPTQAQTDLVRERYRAGINSLATDDANPNYLIAELVIPSATGGWTVHEVGIFDTDGDMVAVANFPATYKPILSEGSGKELVIRIIIETSNAPSVELVIDPSIVLASRSWVVSNFLMRSTVVGGTTGQVLRKASNTDEDFEWSTITTENITVNTVEELQTLSAAQVIVDWAIITTTGAAYYVGGVRLEPGDYTVNSATRITLATSYPAGTKILGAKNEPASNPSEFVPCSVNFDAVAGGRYFLNGNITATLPNTATLPTGSVVIFTRKKTAIPYIEVDGSNSETILTDKGTDTSVRYLVNAQVQFIWTGTQWEV